MNKARIYISKLRALSKLEIGLLFKAMCFLPITGFALRIFGFQKVSEFCLGDRSQCLDKAGSVEEMEVARSAERMINLAATYGIHRASCLTKSLLLVRFLGQFQIPANLKLGTAKTENVFLAHAWVESCGMVLLDSASVTERFTAFSQSKNYDL